MASVKRPNLDLKMGYTGGVTLPGAAEANFAVYVDALGKNFRYVRSSGTTNERPVGPPAGHIYFDTTLQDLFFYTGSAWAEV